MKIAIVGSRKYPDLAQVRRFVQGIAAKYPDATIVSGGALGVDRNAEQEARKCGLKVKVIRPKWKEPHPVTGKEIFNRSAGFERNEEIVKHVNVVVAFIWKNSAGTANTIKHAREWEKELYIYTPEGLLEISRPAD